MAVLWFILSFLFTLLVVVVSVIVHRFGIIEVLFFKKVDKTSKKNGGELVANVLKAHGVKYVFTICGGHISPILVGCEKNGIKVIDTRHDVNGVFAADAVARLSGTVGVACVTAGPGVTNTITAMQNASMAESPVLLLGGAAARITKGQGSLQDIDQLSLFKPICKYSVSVYRIRDIVPSIRKAICIAQSGVPGPVFVELPVDILYPYEIVVKGVPSVKKTSSIGAHFIRWYVELYVARLFNNAWQPYDCGPLPITYPTASQSEVNACAAILKGAQKPVFLLGSQTTLLPHKVNEIQAALEKLGVPCFLGGMSRGLLGRKNPLHIRQRRRDALKEADIVLCAGAVADFRLDYGRVFSRKSKIISINRSKRNLHLNAGIFWKACMYVQADPGLFLIELAKAIGGSCSYPEEWLKTLQDRDAEKDNANVVKATEPVNKHLNPLKVLLKAEEVMSENTILIADGGDFVGSAAYILRPRGPLKWLDPGPFGTLGVGAGFALGAKLCCPDADVWIIYGDGSLGFSIPEYDTFTRHKTPVIALVGNDACWSQIAREQVPMLGSEVACNLEYTDYEVVAKGFGGVGFRVDAKTSDKKLGEVFEEAKKLSHQGKAVLLNCLIGKSDFRAGSISI